MQRATGADLGGLLAEQAGPQAELALALEGVALGVEAADEDEVAVEAPQVVGRQVRDVLVVVGVGHALTLGGQQLDHVRATVADRGGRLLQLGDYLVAHWGSFAGGAGLCRAASGGHPLVGCGARAAVRDGGHVLVLGTGTYRSLLRISQCGTPGRPLRARMPSASGRADARSRWARSQRSAARAPGPGGCGEQALALHEGLAEVLDEGDQRAGDRGPTAAPLGVGLSSLSSSSSSDDRRRAQPTRRRSATRP